MQVSRLLESFPNGHDTFSKGCAMRQSVPSFQGNKRHAACCGKRSTLSSSGSVFPIPHVTKTSVISCCSPLKGTMCVSGVLEIICGLECGDFTTTWFVKSYLIRIWFCKLLFFRCLRTAKKVWCSLDYVWYNFFYIRHSFSYIKCNFRAFWKECAV